MKKKTSKSAVSKPGARPRNAPPQPPDLAGITGIAALAGKTGTRPDQVLAVLALLLCGTAGNEAWLGSLLEGAPLAKLDLLLPAADPPLRRMIEQLVSHVRLINRTLSANLGLFSPEIVAAMLHGAFAGGRPAKIATQGDTEAALVRHRQALERAPSGAAAALNQDLANGVEAHNLEATLHPEFLIENTRCRDLPDALERCHQRAAIVVCPKLTAARGGSEAIKDLKQLIDLVEGTASSQAASPGRAACLPLKAHTLLAAEPADLELMADSVPGLLQRFLWLSGTTGGLDSARDKKAKKGDEPAASDRGGSVEMLMTAFQKALMAILATRRDGRTPAIGFDPAPAAASSYETRMAEYRKWLDTLAQDPADEPGPVARELPSTLYWAIGFLCRELPEAVLPDGETRLAAAFDTAERLVTLHWQHWRELRQRDLLRQQIALARRIMEEVEERAPLRMRELVRSFNQQSKERFLPVIAALIGLKVLARDETGALLPGEARFADEEANLVEFLQSGSGPEPA